ncbi:hypothetical protein [Streptomyces sp. NPDC054865]
MSVLVAIHPRSFLPACRELACLERHDLKCLAYALAVLDDEPLVVLRRPTGTGFEVRIGGIGDNFQPHTLLAHVLVGGGYVPGTVPSAESVRLATDPEPAQGRTQTIATGTFELLTADGERIWNEGTARRHTCGGRTPPARARRADMPAQLERRPILPTSPGQRRADPRADRGRDAELVHTHIVRQRDPPAFLPRCSNAVTALVGLR